MEHGGIMTNKNPQQQQYFEPASLIKIIIVSSIAAGVQFGWALQLSLLTPYVQLLGVPHVWSSFIWLCGPISGLLVQPIAGYYSDRCKSPLGRRRPFIITGTVLVSIAIFLIGYAADLGVKTGDSLEKKTKPRAVTIFVIGFWVLDVANNMLQGPCRAFLADLSENNHKKMRTANSFYSFFMAVGNVLGYAAGSYTGLYKAFPFTKTHACDVYCANLKACFMISICLLVFVTILATTLVSERPHPSVLAKQANGGVSDYEDEEEHTSIPFFGNFLAAFKELSKPMWILLLVTTFNWIGWFPFFLYDTDWMGKEIYGGKVPGTAEEERVYDLGVRAGSLGLMINSIVLAFASLAVEPLSRLFRGAKNLWGTVNFILALGLASSVLITNYANHWREGKPPLSIPSSNVKAVALSQFGVLGIPLSVTYSIPFALASIFCTTSHAGQGLSLGLLNLAIVLPQMFVSVVSGPLNKLAGGGNIPAFLMGAVGAALSGFLAFFVLPDPPTQHTLKHTTDEAED